MNDALETTENTTSANIGIAASIVAAFVSNPQNVVEFDKLGELIKNTYNTINSLGEPAVIEPPKQEPAVSIKSSVKPGYIVCLEDGKKLKMLKRHLMTHYGMTPDDYRAKWGLPSDYPMTSPEYAEQRRKLALDIGLGHSRKAKPVRGRGRQKKVETAEA